MMALILSAPQTTTFLYRPLSIKDAPIVREYRNPEQAADKSNPQAFLAPSLSQAIFAVAGNTWSGVTVPTIRQSISSGCIPLFSHNCLTAGTTISEVAIPAPFRILLSSTPVRVRIHSSLVSTIFSRSKLVSLSSGTYPPTAVIAAVILLLILLGCDKQKCPKVRDKTIAAFNPGPCLPAAWLLRKTLS